MPQHVANVSTLPSAAGLPDGYALLLNGILHRVVSGAWAAIPGTELRTTATHLQSRATGADWVNVMGLSSAAVQQVTIPGMLAGETVAEGTIAVPELFVVLRVEYTYANIRLRVYRTASGRTADAARGLSTAYTGSDLVYEFVPTYGQIDSSPFLATRASNETVLYYRIDNGPSSPIDLYLKEQ